MYAFTCSLKCLVQMVINFLEFFVTIFSVSCHIGAFYRIGGACNAVCYIQHYLYLVKHYITFEKTSSVSRLKCSSSYLWPKRSFSGPISAVPFSMTLVSV